MACFVQHFPFQHVNDISTCHDKSDIEMTYQEDSCFSQWRPWSLQVCGWSFVDFSLLRSIPKPHSKWVSSQRIKDATSTDFHPAKTLKLKLLDAWRPDSMERHLHHSLEPPGMLTLARWEVVMCCVFPHLPWIGGGTKGNAFHLGCQLRASIKGRLDLWGVGIHVKIIIAPNPRRSVQKRL